MFRVLSALIVSVSLGATAAEAASLNIDAADGVWSSAVTTNKPTGQLTGLGTNEVSWGTPWTVIDQRSNYSFVGDAPITRATPGAFLVGAFTHENWTISSMSDSLLSGDLFVTLGGMAGSTLFSAVSSFRFAHDETLNGAPCTIGTNPCGDIVKITALGSGSTSFIEGGKLYTLIIDGFVQTLGGAIVDTFMTFERDDTTLYLQARLIEEPAPVPLPAAGVMMLAGLGALGLLRRKRRA